MEDIIRNCGDMTLDELQHWGIKGQKWGRRRYQNPDGSLTPEGKKRYYNDDGSLTKQGEKYYAGEKKRLEAQKAKVTAANDKKAEIDKLKQDIEDMKSGKTTTSDKPKSAKEMTDDELRKAKARYDLERDYQKSYDQANPQQVDKHEDLQPKNIAKDLLSKSVLPAVQEAGKSLIKDFMVANGKKILGLEKDPPPGSIEALKKIADKLKVEADISQYKMNIAKNKNQQQDQEEKIKNREEAANRAKENAKKAEEAKAEKARKAEETKADAQRQVDEYNRKLEEEYNLKYNNPNAYHMKGKDVIDSFLNNNTSKDYISKGFLLEDRSSKELIVGESRVDEILDRHGKHITFFSHSDITLDDIEALVHHGIKGQKWGVRRYQNPNGSLTAEGKEHRDKREGRNKYRVKDTATASGGKGDNDEKLSFKKLRKRDIENGYVDKNGFGNCTEKGHKYEKERRNEMTVEEQTAELKKLNEYWTGEFFNGERAYKSTKLNTEITNFVLDKHDGSGQVKSHTEKVKVAYDNLSKAIQDYGSKNGFNLVFTKQGQNDLEPYRQEIDSAVLSDLGYADTSEARKYIRDFWDYD